MSKYSYNPRKFDENRPNVGVTIAPFVYNQDKNEINVLVYKRNEDAEVFPGEYALSNHFYDIKEHETLEVAAASALSEKSNIEIPHMKKFNVYSGNYIDPERINTVNVAYYAILKHKEVIIKDPLKEYNSKWLPIDEACNIVSAFNHKEILIDAYKELKEVSTHSNIVFDLLPDEFTITELQSLLELLMETKLDKARFRGRIKKYGVLEKKEGFRTGPFRPAQLYSKNKEFKGNFYPKTIS